VLASVRLYPKGLLSVKINKLFGCNCVGLRAWLFSFGRGVFVVNSALRLQEGVIVRVYQKS